MRRELGTPLVLRVSLTLSLLLTLSLEFGHTASARSALPDASPIFSHLRTDNFSSVVASGNAYVGRIGDLDGDGLSDFAVGFPTASPGGKANAGVVQILSGADGSLVDSLEGANAGDGLGSAIAGLGDIDNDGIPDFAVGADRMNMYAGAVFVMSGADRSELYHFNGTSSYGYVGRTLASAPGPGGDGETSLLVSRLVSGSAAYVDVLAGADGSMIHTLGPMLATTATSTVPAPAGDVNGDGYQDWLVYDSDINFESGDGDTLTYVFSGQDGGLLFSTPITHNIGNIWGASAAAGDLNDDQVGDFWMGSSGFDCGGLTSNGAVKAFLGPDGGSGAEVCGEATGDQFGGTLATLPDLDLDAIPELVVGARLATPTGIASSGRIYLLRGRDGAILGHAESTQTDAHFARQVVDIGDITGDGRDDIAVVGSDSSGAPSIEFFAINYGPRFASLFIGQGFDQCAAPSLEEMQAWADLSPYGFVGIYLNGENTGCGNDKLTAGWVSTARQAGWTFAPIWPGLQSYCKHLQNPNSQPIDNDTVTAEAQGVQAADDALQQAQDLGLVDGSQAETVIYLDIEPFDRAIPECHANAVDAFVSGWVSEMNLKGNLAGVYGHAKDMSGWLGIPHVPDAAWIAGWIPKGWDPTSNSYIFAQDPNAPLTGIPLVDDSDWLPHRRIRQYAGEFEDSYGPYPIRIDANVADAPVANAGTPSIASVAGPSAASLSTSFKVQAMGLLSEDIGWIWVDHSLRWTTNGGLSWTDITPSAVANKAILAVDFPDATHGWMMSVFPPGPELYLSRTSDAGATWNTTLFGDCASDELPGGIFLNALDSLHAWAVIRLPGSSNFSDGVLFRTTDGGATWTQLSIPSGNPVHFISPTVGWTLGGPGRDVLYHSTDGGDSWAPQGVNPAPSGTPDVIFNLPTFSTSVDGVLPVVEYDQSTSQVDFYVSDDGGTTWNLDTTESSGRDLRPGSIFPIAVVDPSTHFMPAPGSLSNLSGAVMHLSFATSEVGWAFTSSAQCAPSQNGPECASTSTLMGTANGGESWAELPVTGTMLFLPIVIR